MAKGKLSKKYYKKLALAILFFVLINVFYVITVVHLNFTFANLFFLVLIDIIVFMTLVAEYVL